MRRRIATLFVVKQSGLATGSSRLGLGAQSNTTTGNADYLITQIGELPFVRDVIQRQRAFV